MARRLSEFISMGIIAGSVRLFSARAPRFNYVWQG